MKTLPTIHIIGDKNICKGTSTILKASGADSYVWNTGDEEYSIEVSPEVQTTYSVIGITDGCPGNAIFTVNVKDKPEVQINGNSTVCEGESITLTATGANSYEWAHGGTDAEISVQPTSETTYTVTGSINGCSATVTHTVSIKSKPTVQIGGEESVCAGTSVTLTANGADDYSWDNDEEGASITVTPTDKTTYTVTGTTNGCSATASHTINVKAMPTVQISGDESICEGNSTTLTASGAEEYSWDNDEEGASITVSPVEPTTYIVTGTTNGCSATASHTISVKEMPIVEINGDESVCEGESITLTATGANSYEWAHGGNNAETTVQPASATTYTVTGTTNGCSATATHTVSIKSKPTVGISGEESICAGNSTTLTANGADEYSWDTEEEDASIEVTPETKTTYTVTGTTNGCSATATHTVNVKAMPTVQISGEESICEGKSTTLTASGAEEYSWDNDEEGSSITISPVESTIYIVTGTTNGCSATASHTISIKEMPVVEITGDESVCKGKSTTLTASGAEEYSWDNDEEGASITVTPTAESTYTVTGSINGCSATASHTVTVKEPKTYEFEAVACNQYTWENDILTESGTHTKTYTAANGCDSIVTLHLTINKSVEVEFDEMACGQFVWAGDTYEESQVITKTFTGSNGCDSTVTINLTISDIIYKEFEATACDYYMWDHKRYIESGDYTKEYKSSQGCDSIVTLHLTIHDSDYTDDYVTACKSYVWGDEQYTQSGDYEQTFTNANNCDSTVTLHLTINEPVETEFEAQACNSYTWNNEIYEESGDYEQTFTAANNCDSIVTLHLTINYASTNDEYITACDKYDWEGETYTSSQNITKTFTDANQCDSTVTLHLTISNSVTVAFDSVACGPVEWNGETYEKSGDYTITLTTVDNCDSIVTMNLTINHPVYTDITKEACKEYYWENDRYDESGEYQKTYTARNGCDSIVTLNLTIYEAATTNIVEQACDSFIWAGTKYTRSGIYTEIFTSSHNCDSTVTLDLTINHPVTSSFDTISCRAVTWNGTIYAESGNYEQTFTAANGCDSIVTMNLEIRDCGFECGFSLLSDVDNNEYKTIQHGSTCWMAENLKTEHYADGTEIPGVMIYVSKLNANAEENLKQYGYLYDWAAATRTEVTRTRGLRATSNAVQGACPKGWRLPTADDFLMLLGMDNTADDLRSTNCWVDKGGTNILGTDIRPGGYYNNANSQFSDMGGRAYLIIADTSIPAGSPTMKHVTLTCNCPALLFEEGPKANAYSVRCVQNIIERP